MAGGYENEIVSRSETQDNTNKESGFHQELQQSRHGRVETPLYRDADGKVHTPDRQPDSMSKDGARMWEQYGKLSCVKNAAGEIYHFKYDGKGQLSQMSEPDGSFLIKKGDGEWERTNAKGEHHTFKGEVKVGQDGSVTYEGAGGQDTIHKANGDIVERETVDGHKRVARHHHKGHITAISYDAESQPFSVQNPDGSWFVKGTDNNWYKSDGSGNDQYTDNKFVRQADGTVQQLDGKGKLVAQF